MQSLFCMFFFFSLYIYVTHVILQTIHSKYDQYQKIKKNAHCSGVHIE